MTAQYRRIRYEDGRGSGFLNVVTYIIYPGKQIVFTGCKPSDSGYYGSSINHAEKIVHAIAKQEGIDARDFTFFDLQTNEGYASHKIGEYSFSKLVIEWNGDAIIQLDWVDGYCIEIVLRHFGGFIGTPPYKNHSVDSRNDNTETTNTLQDLLDILFEIVCMYDENSMLETKMECIEHLAIPMKRFFKEQGIEDVSVEVLANFPRKTLLGESSQRDFCEFCEWILEKHPEFSEMICPVLFI